MPIVPTVPLPPAIPFTFHVTVLFVVFSTVAVNCLVCFTRTLALVGEIETDTGVAAVTVTNTVFDVVPSGQLTLTGTDGFAAGALPMAVIDVDDTKVDDVAAPSKETAQPVTNPAPVMVSVKLPAGNDDGLTVVMPGKGRTVTAALPDEPGEAVLVAPTVTVGGAGGVSGAKYFPVVSI